MNYPLTPTARLAAHAIHEVLDPLIEALLDRLREAWDVHLRLLAGNSRYAAAVAAGAAVLMGQDSPLDLIAAITAALIANFTATRRVIAHL